MSLLLAAAETLFVSDSPTCREVAELTPQLAAFNPATWRLLHLLGRGGMGKVFLAQRRETSVVRAVKFTRCNGIRSSGAEIARLDHPHIARVYCSGRLGKFVVTEMEYVAGRTWLQLVVENGPPVESTVALLGAQAASGLANLHRNGLVHRDVQPRNLLVDRRRSVKLIDFDLVQSIGSEVTTTIAGTPDYMAPEQIRADAPLTDRADVYGLGCTLFFLLTGRAPFSSSNGTVTELMRAHLRETPPAIEVARPDISGGMAELVTSMLAKSPLNRPAASEVAVRLAQCEQRKETALLFV